MQYQVVKNGDSHIICEPETPQQYYEDGWKVYDMDGWEFQPLKPGDKLYSYWNGELVTVEFIEENLAQGASVTTYILKDADGREFRCSKTMYLPSKQAVMKRYLKECEEALPQLIEHRKEVEENIKFARQEILRVTELINYVKE